MSRTADDPAGHQQTVFVTSLSDRFDADVPLDAGFTVVVVLRTDDAPVLRDRRLMPGCPVVAPAAIPPDRGR
ncbi:hypothetical protein ACFVHB_37325 [Kitasatospora sp. NPDC127111]|uniref:hypothetical protein n=1 Tax=Kitasatospora sp. NPDC127111 TaxID=3345363 RepID=UPI00363C161E